MFSYLAEGASTHAVLQPTWWQWALLTGVIPLGTIFGFMYWNRNDGPEPSKAKMGVQAFLSIVAGVVACIVVFYLYGGVATKEYLTGWTVELSLSIDNVFIWLIVAQRFGLWRGDYAKLVQIGVVTAIVLRVGAILLGIKLLEAFWWVSLLLVALVVRAALVAFKDEDNKERKPHSNRKRLIRKLVSKATTEAGYGATMLNRSEGGLKLTKFGVAAVAFGGVDLMFALDSIPAILSVARDPMIVISSNMMALIGLQCFFFVIGYLQKLFHKLGTVIGYLLLFIAAKILIGCELFDWLGRELDWWPKAVHSYEIPINWSLGVIASLLAIGVLWSLATKKPGNKVLVAN